MPRPRPYMRSGRKLLSPDLIVTFSSLEYPAGAVFPISRKTVPSGFISLTRRFFVTVLLSGVTVHAIYNLFISSTYNGPLTSPTKSLLSSRFAIISPVISTLTAEVVELLRLLPLDERVLDICGLAELLSFLEAAVMALLHLLIPALILRSCSEGTYPGSLLAA